MPLRLSSKQVHRLKGILDDFCSDQHALTLELKDFGCFAPKVIFIDVVPHKELIDLQNRLTDTLKRKMSIFNANYRDGVFHPHVTLAFRDLRKSKFHLAWEKFNKKDFSERVTVKHLTLLIHREGRWHPESKYPLG